VADFLNITLYVIVGVVAFLVAWSFRASWRYWRRQRDSGLQPDEDVEEETEEQQG